MNRKIGFSASISPSTFLHPKLKSSVLYLEVRVQDCVFRSHLKNLAAWTEAVKAEIQLFSKAALSNVYHPSLTLA